ncbi:unnamed protein product [Prunus armeniaca]
MTSSIEAGGSWTTMKDVSLCEYCVQVGHCPITDNEMKLSHMRRKFMENFVKDRRDALAKASNNVRSGENLGNEIIQAQMWFDVIGQGKKSFNNQQC